MAYETIQLSVDDGVAEITLNRPERLNAWTDQLGSDLRNAILSDAEKRDTYDRYGHEGLQGVAMPDFGDIGSILRGFGLGDLLGGLFGEILSLFKLRHPPVKLLPIWVKSPWYWTMTILMILSGGGLVVIYMKSSIAVAPILAVNIGASALLILGTLVAQAPAIAPGNVN